ncbi:hypothetical protein [Cypionkella sinensis]|uniref:Uncharacterized protein n=1 Tax=Cypionkella sinensis TaxID=1756043 RepID=A0ABV7IXI2_9RHOB
MVGFPLQLPIDGTIARRIVVDPCSDRGIFPDGTPMGKIIIIELLTDEEAIACVLHARPAQIGDDA